MSANSAATPEVRTESVTGGVPLIGTLDVPGDKSISHRALLLAALAEGTSTVTGLSDGDDVLRTEQALGQNSKAVHRAYAKRAQVTVPSLEDYEELAEKNLVRVEFARPGTAVTAAKLPDHSRSNVTAG